MKLKFHAKNNDLIIKESERLISGSVNIYTCEFTFDESWDGYTVTAVFSTNGSRLVNMAVVDGKCQIPVEVLRPNARIRVGIFGTDGVRSRPTTYSDWVTVEQGADMTGNTAQPPTPSVYEQWMNSLDEKHDEWNANEQARVEAENARVEAEQAREDKETGYVAQAKAYAESAQVSKEASAASQTVAEAAKASAENSAISAAQNAAIAQNSATNALNYSNEAAYSAAQAKISETNAKASEEAAATVEANAVIASTAATNAAASETSAREAQIAAEKARDEAAEIAGGDFATKTEAQGYANTAETNANTYTDQKISAIPAPDVSGQIGDHNADGTAHPEIRQKFSQVIGEAVTNANTYTDQKIAAIPTPDVSGQINTHNTSSDAHSDIRTALNGKEASGTAASAVSTHNTSGSAHSDIRDLILQSAGYTKAQTLADATKTMFGLGSSAVPNDVFSFLGKYNQHTWKRRTATQDFIVSASPTTGYFMGANSTNTVSYSTELSVDSSGNVSLKNPSTVNIACNDNGPKSIKSTLLGKYVTNLRKSHTQTTALSGVYFVPADATIYESSSGYYNAYTNVYAVTYGNVYGEAWETVSSSNRNAYPDSGVSGGYDYQYVGVPFDNAKFAPKIATGSYTGTGIVSDYATLAFDFEPKLVVVVQQNAGAYVLIAVKGVSKTRTQLGDTASSSDVTLVWDANKLKYAGSRADYMLNSSGVIYNYIAID